MTPHAIPQRPSLVAQTVEILREGILAGRWRDSLPGERQLSASLQISRSTLRSALAIISGEKLLSVRKRHPSRITLPGSKSSYREQLWGGRVACILPEPLWQQRAFMMLWLDLTRERLQKTGTVLDIQAGQRYYKKDAARFLQELTRRHPRDCWLLLKSTLPMQSWFQKSGLPVIITGSLMDGITMPSLDYDHYKVGRHAAGVFLGRGHRNIAMICGKPNNAGVIACEAAFRGVVTKSTHADVKYAVEYHNETVAGICRAMDRLLACLPRPTALFFMPSKDWLTASGYLAARGVRIPQDMSIILAQDDPHFSQLYPEPARYLTSSSVYSKQLVRMIQQIREHTLPGNIKTRLLPVFAEGKSIRSIASTAREGK